MEEKNNGKSEKTFAINFNGNVDFIHNSNVICS